MIHYKSIGISFRYTKTMVL